MLVTEETRAPAATTPEEPVDSVLLGRLEAEAFDARLREIERTEREGLLARLALSPESCSASDEEIRPAASRSEILRLKREIDRFAEFHRALVRSRSWRLLQFLRRPFGRAW
ncbi:MAG TPA: hypothetical protein VN783_09165 [Thermoanaerobaculia bacterium]|nr:hypothetical protein [Thermoanaerobaculia bacterium]